MKMSTEEHPLPIDGSPVTGGCWGVRELDRTHLLSSAVETPEMLTIHHHAGWEICYPGARQGQILVWGHTISLMQIWYGTSNNEQLELFWNLFETWEDSDALRFTHFSVRVELLAVWPSFHLPCMSTGYLFTQPVNFTFTSKRSWIYHIRLKQSPIQGSRPLETTEFNTRCQSKIRFGSRLQLSFCSIMNQD